MRIWVTGPYGSKEPLDVRETMRIESLRRLISQIPVIREQSGAWTINGWSSPKLLLGSKMLVDGKTLDECGIKENSVVHPLYDSQAYGLTVLDPDFYGEMVPQDVKLPPCPPCCENAKDKVSDGLAGLWSWTQDTASNLASGVAPRQWACVAGVGLAISQDDELRFVVEAVAPGGGAEEEGTIKVGDVVTSVDGVPCVNTRGLSQAQIEGIRQMPPDNGEESAAGEPARSISTIEALQSRLRGFPMSHVWLRIARGGGWREYDVEVPRKVLPSLAASYM